MSVQTKNPAKARNKFALRLMPSVHLGAKKISEREGVSLNQFINLAIAEKVARLEHQHWASSRKPIDDAARADALDLLRRGGKLPPGQGDEVPAELFTRRQKKVSASSARSVQGSIARG